MQRFIAPVAPRLIALIAALGLWCALALPAAAQNTTGLTVTTCGSPTNPFKAGNPGPFTVNLSGQLCITGSVSASLTGFNAESYLTPFTATTGGVASTSFTAGKVIVVSNAGTTNTAYCKLGAASTVSGQPIMPGSWFAFTTIAETQVTCATSASTTTINVAVGTGLPTGAGGGGGSGGGGGGAVTIADGADVMEGAIADAAVTAGATGSVSAKLRSISRDVMTVNTWAGGTLGAMAAYGTSPGAVNVPGVNAYVTNTTPLGQAAMAASSPVVIASNQTANALWGHGVTGAAVPANATYMGFNSGGNLTGPSITTPLPVNNTGPYPIGSVPYTATNTGTTGATTATLAGASSVTTYICGFSIRANATAAATGNATVTGVITATMNFTQWTAPNASGLGVTEMIFSPCIPASGTNQSVAVVSAAPGTGGVVSVTAWGYKL